MTNRNAEPTQEYAGGALPPPPPPLPPPPSSSLSRDQPDSSHHRGGNMVFKSGPLFLSSKGIGWTSWKKRWFILTSTSLVFFRSDPSAVPQKGSEVNLTLGGIDLNNSGSVVVKADKKLLTVLFPDGRDGRAFTLKAETLEDLQEWKAALENALAQAPSAGHSMGQNGVFKNDQTDSLDGTSDQLKNRQPARSTVLGRPLLLALEDVDGTPSFLEKALKFMEEHGVKVEGILRQAADVDDVEHRIREYEQGKSEFSPEEDAHVIGDCVKYVLRELPSSPVPASCCNALLEACRTDRGVRVNAMRTAIYETFPEPNRRLLQRILMMMQSVAAHKAENRMSTSAVAACMAPLLLRPLLSGDCEIESDFNVGGDGSIQLLQAAAAANHAQAIVITLLEEYNSIFGCLQEGSMSPELYSDTEDSGSETGEATDDELSYDDEEQEYTSGSDSIDDEDAISETCSEDANSGDNDLYDDKDSHGSTFISKSTRVYDKTKSNRETLPSQIDKDHSTENVLNQGKNSSNIQDNKFAEALGDVSRDASLIHRSFDRDPSSLIQHSATMSNGNDYNSRRRTVWGRTAAKKNLSMESIDYSLEDEVEIQQFEVRKRELQNKIAEEVKENAILQVGLERRKKALHEHRQALEQDVAKLQERLQKERDLRAALEAGLKGSQVPLPSLANIDEKTKAELEEISILEVDIVNLKQKMDGLVVQLDQQDQIKKDKQMDVDVVHQPFFERSKSKETNLDKKGNENERKLEPALIAKPEQGRYNPPVISKRSSIRGEGANSTSSALTKLTTRLNFLKERRSQIANELQNMDKVRVSSQSFENIEKNKGSEPDISIQNSENSHGSAAQSIQNREKGRTLDYFQSLQTSENEAVNSEDTRKSYTGVGKRSEGRRLQSLERGKSDTYPTDKVDD